MDLIDQFYAENDFSALQKITIIIPTYNRNFHLSRCIWYLSHFPFKEIIVADSSIGEKKAINRQTIDKFSRGNITYIEYEPETLIYGEDIIKKHADSISRVQTEYCVFTVDKEFIIPTTLCKCIDFLEHHPDYDTINGIFIYTETSNQKEIKFTSPFPSKRSIDYADPIVRLLMSLTSTDHVSSISLGVRRATTHKKIYSSLEDYSIQYLRMGEIAISYLTIILSKCAFLSDNIHSIRDTTHVFANGHFNRSESSCLRYPLIDEFIINGVKDTSFFERFINCMVDNLLIKTNKLSKEEAEILLKSYFIKAFQDIGVQRRESDAKPDLFQRILSISINNIIGNLIQKKKTISPSNLNINVTPELEVFKSVMEDTSYLHSTDSPLDISAVRTSDK
jgi:glycosyltransferase domain-containing protein